MGLLDCLSMNVCNKHWQIVFIQQFSLELSLYKLRHVQSNFEDFSLKILKLQFEYTYIQIYVQLSITLRV